MALIFNNISESMSIHFTCPPSYFSKLSLTQFFIITSIRADSAEPFCSEHLPISNLMKPATNRHPLEWHNKFNFFYMYKISPPRDQEIEFVSRMQHFNILIRGWKVFQTSCAFNSHDHYGTCFNPSGNRPRDCRTRIQAATESNRISMEWHFLSLAACAAV